MGKLLCKSNFFLRFNIVYRLFLNPRMLARVMIDSDNDSKKFVQS